MLGDDFQSMQFVFFVDQCCQCFTDNCPVGCKASSVHYVKRSQRDRQIHSRVPAMVKRFGVRDTGFKYNSRLQSVLTIV